MQISALFNKKKKKFIFKFSVLVERIAASENYFPLNLKSLY